MMLRSIKAMLAVVVLAVSAVHVNASPNVTKRANIGGQQKTTAGGTCKPAEANIDLDINNIRARLMTGGDMWWDIGSAEARYEVPKGSKKNSLFAGSVWIGGFDPQGQLKVAAQTYRQDGNDYWPGPLDDNAAITEGDCAAWDRFWKINKSDVNKFKELSDKSSAKGDATYEAIFQWPAKGNDNAVGANGSNLDLATTAHNMAPFVDVDFNGLYNPSNGDYPDMKGDQMIWWVYNDKGNTKQQSQTEGIGIEIQASAFAYASKDQLNDATFYNYRLINRSNLKLDSTYMATWTDADLGYAYDDYIGCDTAKGLGILYNGKSEDGNGQVNSYGTKIPMVGIDFFKGPLKPNGDTVVNGVTKTKYKQLGMESFTYYNNDNTIIGNPDNGVQIYYYMTGSIRNGQRFSNDFIGPNIVSKAYGSNLPPTRFVFTGDPGKPSEWSECTCNNPVGDRRFIHSSGPFTLEPGVVNDITIGAVWVADAGGCPKTDFKKIRSADELAQGLFDNNFETIEGPEAPRMVVRELNRKLVFYLVNDPVSNNYRELYGRDTAKKYRVSSVKAAKYVKAKDSLYKFEGYRVFQLKNSSVQAAQIFNERGEVDNDLAQEVFQCDVKNGIKRIINYDKDIEVSDTTYRAIIKVDGADSGIKHSFLITQDLFATGAEKRLVNYRNYYFVAIAYAYNNFSNGFDINRADSTQDLAYLESAHGAGGIPIPIVVGMPNPANGDMGNVLNSDYGSGVVIKRLEGTGNGGNELQLSQESENIALAPPYQAVTPVYEAGKGPINVKVIDPVKVVGANWELFIKGNTSVNPGLGLDSFSWWYLVNNTTGDTIYSEQNRFTTYNEQILESYGLSVAINQIQRPGEDQVINESRNKNGLITSDIKFADTTQPWLGGVIDGENRSPLNWIRSGGLNNDTVKACEYNDRTGPGLDTAISAYESLLQKGVYTKGTWAPYSLASDEDREACGFGVIRKNTWSNIYNIPSVDIVLTSDKSKWTRSMVFEMQDAELLTEGNAAKTDLRRHRSWNMEVDANGRPVYATNPADTGMSWFPGYAINQETGERLNIAFSEDSWLKQYNGADMIWNPTSDYFTGLGDIIFGGKHYVYILGSKYDSCKSFLNTYNISSIGKSNAFKTIQWVGATMLAPGYKLKSLSEGIIPNDVRIKFRVTRPYAKYTSPLEAGTNLRNGGLPLYSFSTMGLQPTPLADNTNADKKALLEKIHVVPNPYYAYAGYEQNALDSRVRIINLPAKASIDIYSLDGALIRRLEKDNPKVSYIDWDIRNAKGLPIASGMYMIHVNAQGIGETVLKWFGAMRPLDVKSN